MARLLDDLLDASRVTQNKIELRRRVVDLRLVASEAVDSVRPQARERDLELSLKLAPQPLWVHGDATRLQQIHVNLLTNAVKYTPRGGHVTLTAEPDGSGAAVVRVIDNGAGIPSQTLDSIFDLFVQAKHTLDHADGGLGVGLTVVRALVEMHGGTINAHSDGDGKGSEFTVKLPMTAAPTETAVQTESPASGIPAGITVVVVEDNADSLEMLCSVLKLAGATCHTAQDGRSALALIDKVSPDVAILDVGLPHLDGLEVARRVRSNPRHAGIRLIALTGYGLPSDRQATAQAGFDCHLVKPVQPADLFKAIAEDRAATDPLIAPSSLGSPSALDTSRSGPTSSN